MVNLFAAGASSAAYLEFLVKHVLQSESFPTFTTIQQLYIYKLVSDFQYYNASPDVVTLIATSMQNSLVQIFPDSSVPVILEENKLVMKRLGI
jgi:hypothetical protein